MLKKIRKMAKVCRAWCSWLSMSLFLSVTCYSSTNMISVHTFAILQQNLKKKEFVFAVSYLSTQFLFFVHFYSVLFQAILCCYYYVFIFVALMSLMCLFSVSFSSGLSVQLVFFYVLIVQLIAYKIIRFVIDLALQILITLSRMDDQHRV